MKFKAKSKVTSPHLCRTLHLWPAAVLWLQRRRIEFSWLPVSSGPSIPAQCINMCVCLFCDIYFAFRLFPLLFQKTKLIFWFGNSFNHEKTFFAHMPWWGNSFHSAEKSQHSTRKVTVIWLQTSSTESCSLLYLPVKPAELLCPVLYAKEVAIEKKNTPKWNGLILPTLVS